MILTALQVFTMMLDIGIAEPTAHTLTCIAKHESAFDTRAMNYNTNRTYDYGLLQINDLWMRDACEGLSLYSPYENLICAKRILKQRGFDAWVGYNRNKRECDAYRVGGTS